MNTGPSSTPDSWHAVANLDEIESPSLLVYPDRIGENIRRMIAVAGTAGRLRPHLKTVKMGEVVGMLLGHGIRQFKCATIAEAEMAAAAGAPDVLLAGQPAGPNVRRLTALASEYPGTTFGTIVDDASAARALSAAASAAGLGVEVWVDLDCGMHRTGMPPGPEAAGLFRQLASLPGLKPAGLHAYDGHIHEADPVVRAQQCEAAFAPVSMLRFGLERELGGRLRVVAGGTPTFPIHARRGDVECSPGTCLLWDFGYADRFADLDFLQAALVLTRVVSKPSPKRLCLDLGHKAVAAENPHPRVRFPDLPDAVAVMHSEEHLVIETAHAGGCGIGHPLLGIPRHICPTVALHAEAAVVRGGRVVERWQVTARDRRITI